MITDKYGLVHPEEEVRRVVARLETLLAQAGDPGQRAALERAVAAKRALLGAAGPQEAPGAEVGGETGERPALKLRAALGASEKVEPQDLANVSPVRGFGGTE